MLFCIGHAVGSGADAGMLPKLTRAACVSAETGFHSAIVLNTGGRLSDGTNVLAINVRGNSTIKEALFTTSGVRTARPIHAITHENAYEKNSSRA